MGWFRKPDRPEIARRKGSRTTRVCRFEQMEARLMLSADPIYIGAVFTETSSTSLESEGDRFEISWVGGANGTQLTQLQISGDINQNGILDNGDVFFDIDGSNPGVGPFFPFTIANDSDIKAQDITWSLSPDKTTLILTISGWDAGEKLIFEIDADELDNAPNSLVDGAEFQGSILTATWIDTNGHHEVITGSGIFFDNYDHLIASGVNVPRDSDLPPSEGTHERTAGTGFSVQQEVRPFTISGRVYHDVNLNGQYNGGAETGIANVELSLNCPLLVRDGYLFHFVALADCVHHILPFKHLAKHRVLVVEPGRGHVGDEELRPIGIGAGIGHRQNSGARMLEVGVKLIGKFVTGATGSGALRTAGLNHEIRDHAVKLQAVIKSIFRQFLKIGHGLGNLVVEKFAADGALVRLNGGDLHGEVFP